MYGFQHTCAYIRICLHTRTQACADNGHDAGWRYQMNRQPDSSEDTEALRQEIQAAIAAGRELDPGMDKHLADSVLERYRSDQAARQRALASSASRSQSLDRPSPSGEVAQIAGATIAGIVGVVAFIVILLTHPEFWWLIFLIPGLF